MVILLAAVLSAPAPAPGRALLAPSLSAWLGTDILGRDVLYRTFLGLGYTLGQASLVLAVCLCIGIPVAILSALWYERWHRL